MAEDRIGLITVEKRTDNGQPCQEPCQQEQQRFQSLGHKAQFIRDTMGP